MDRPRHHRAQQHSYPRTVRVNALLQEILAEEIERLADADERLRLLTLTAVICEPDFRRATVLFASLPGDAAEALDEHRKALQTRIARQVRLRRTPMLEFATDGALAAAERVEEALRRAGARATSAGANSGDDGSTTLDGGAGDAVAGDGGTETRSS